MSALPETILGVWALEKVLGPTLKSFGNDINKLYKNGVDKIVKAALKKIDDTEGKKCANLRVARDVFWNGSFTDDAICAEYFGGILASSRSEDGKDDNGIHYTDVIKSLSSKQLELHYAIYNSLNKLFISRGKDVNVALSESLQAEEIWFFSFELSEKLDLNVFSDLVILYKQGLLHEYKTDALNVMVKATSFGVMLYAIAHNKFNEWQHFSAVEFGDFDGIQLPQLFAGSKDDLLSKVREIEQEQ